MKVSAATKASIDCSEMDAQLDALRRNLPPVRIATSDRSSARFLSRLQHKKPKRLRSRIAFLNDLMVNISNIFHSRDSQFLAGQCL